MSQKGPWTTPKRFKRSSSTSGAASKKSWTSGRRRLMVSAWKNPQGRTAAWHGSPFGRSMRTELTYAQNVSMTATAGAPAEQLFSINSLYDPDVTGTGTQPRFYDTLCGANNGSAPYNRYRVYGSKIEVTFFPLGSDSTSMRGLVAVGLFNTNATKASSIAEMLARSDYKTKFIGYWSGGHDVAKITRRCSNAEFFDVADITSNPELGAEYNASPALSGRWCVTYLPGDELSSRDIRIFVKITYDVEFYNRNDVADS